MSVMAALALVALAGALERQIEGDLFHGSRVGVDNTALPGFAVAALVSPGLVPGIQGVGLIQGFRLLRVDRSVLWVDGCDRVRVGFGLGLGLRVRVRIGLRIRIRMNGLGVRVRINGLRIRIMMNGLGVRIRSWLRTRWNGMLRVFNRR